MGEWVVIANRGTSVNGGWKLISICCVVGTGNFGMQRYSAM